MTKNTGENTEKNTGESKVKAFATPNPNTMKFMIEGLYYPQPISYEITMENLPPFVNSILSLGKMERVFISRNFISITKQESESWKKVYDGVLSVLNKVSRELSIYAPHMNSPHVVGLGENNTDINSLGANFANPVTTHTINSPITHTIPAMSGTGTANNHEFRDDYGYEYDYDHEYENLFEKESIEWKIQQVLNEQIRPAVSQDGGDIILVDFHPEYGLARVKMMGACVGCPYSMSTLSNGVETAVKNYVPEVKNVIAI